MQLKFPDLFEGLEYSPRCAALEGAVVEIAGWVVDTHDGAAQVLVAEPGGCPHCSPVPAVSLPAFRSRAGQAVTLRGTLSYGFQVDAAGNASFLRLEGARVSTGIPT
ncbi:MAG: hypothetical protein ACT4P9_02680 [Betaproteobacteria bacterium]